MHGENMKLKM